MTLSIGEVARKAGLKPTTLRYYESVGLLPPPPRVAGQRCYDKTIFQQLAIIKLAQKAGFTIAEIRALLHDFPAAAAPSERWTRYAVPKLQEIHRLIERAQQMERLLQQVLQCECDTLTDCGQAMSQHTL